MNTLKLTCLIHNNQAVRNLISLSLFVIIVTLPSVAQNIKNKIPMVMWHGIGQVSKTWETTPDGREG
jgi:hypothetical protein